MQTITTKGSNYRTNGKVYTSVLGLAAEAKSLAAATGCTVTVDTLADGRYRLLVAVSGKAEPKVNRAAELASTTAVVGKMVTFGSTVGEVEPAFNTADQYAETSEAQDNRDWALSNAAVQQQDDLEAGAARDAVRYLATKRAKQTRTFVGPSAFSAAKEFAKSKGGSMKREAEGWTVTWVGQAFVAREGDAGYRAAAFVPGLLHTQRDDAVDHGPCDCSRCSEAAARIAYVAE